MADITFSKEELAKLSAVPTFFMMEVILSDGVRYVVEETGSIHLKRCLVLLSRGRALDENASDISLCVGDITGPFWTCSTLEVLQTILKQL